MSQLPFRKIAVLAVIVVLILAVGGFGYFLFAQGGWSSLSWKFWEKGGGGEPLENTNAGSNVNAFPENPQSPQEAADSQALKDAFQMRDRTLCAPIADEDKRSLCVVYAINAEAVQAKDASKCRDIESEFYRNDCLDNMTIFFARTDHDKAKCGELIDKSRVEACERSIP